MSAVASFIRRAHGCEPLCPTLPDLSSPTRPTASRRSCQPYTPSQAAHRDVFAPTNQCTASPSLPGSHSVSEARHLWTQLLPPGSVVLRFLQYRPDVSFTALSRIESPYSIPSNAAPAARSPSLTNAQPQPYRMIGGRCPDLPPVPCLSKTRIHLTTPRLSKMRIHLVACRNISAENSAPTPQRCPIERAKL